MSLSLSAVIPTRNRPHDLGNAVASLLGQTRPPNELLIVDQSPGDESAALVRELFRAPSHTELVYIHDTAVTGLVDAKRVGSARAKGDIVCFLEDDVILEPEYMARIESGFLEKSEMCGCGGVAVNQPWSGPMYVLVHKVFFRGIFQDPRVKLFTRALNGAKQLIPCDVLSGGVSCWRREVFEAVPFDTSNGFFMLEDMDFSTRVVKAFGHRLYINPQARLHHVGSPVNRDRQGTRQRRKAIEALAFYKKRKRWTGARRGLLLALTWWFGEAVMQAVRLGSVGPVTGYCRGVAEGVRKAVRERDETGT